MGAARSACELERAREHSDWRRSDDVHRAGEHRRDLRRRVHTPEAAAVGAALAFGYALWQRSLGGGNLSKVLIETVNTTRAGVPDPDRRVAFGPFLVLSGLRKKIAQSLAGLDAPRVVILINDSLAVYILLGTFLEGFLMLVLTLLFVRPIIKALGYDPIWFGASPR